MVKTSSVQTTHLPPQAYTRDVLIHAYEWLSTQPPSVRERATTADALVSLFMQARRRHYYQPQEAIGQMEWEAPGAESFKADLKSLAEGLKQFDSPLAPPHTTQSPALSPPTVPATQVAPPLQPPAPYSPTLHNPTPQPPATAESLPTNSMQSTTKIAPIHSWAVDERTLELARDIQAKLNLGSEIEAIRMMVVLGHKHLQQTLLKD